MSCCLLNQLSPMSQDESLLGILAPWLNSVNELGKDDLDFVSGEPDGVTSSDRTVLPLPVARDIPSRL